MEGRGRGTQTGLPGEGRVPHTKGFCGQGAGRSVLLPGAERQRGTDRLSPKTWFVKGRMEKTEDVLGEGRWPLATGWGTETASCWHIAPTPPYGLGGAGRVSFRSLVPAQALTQEPQLRLLPPLHKPLSCNPITYQPCRIHPGFSHDPVGVLHKWVPFVEWVVLIPETSGPP